jgi:hypothetical protein
MKSSPINPCRVLSLGKDVALLQSRTAVLRKAGFCSDATTNLREFLDCVSAADPGYEVFIVCHSVAAGDRAFITDTAEEFHAPVYVLKDLTRPEDLLKHVREMIAPC